MEHLCLQAPFQTPPKVLIIIMKLGECTALWGECERVAGCICVSEKIPGKRLKQLMYMPVFVEKCISCVSSSWFHCTIAGVKYRVYRRGGRS